MKKGELVVSVEHECKLTCYSLWEFQTLCLGCSAFICEMGLQMLVQGEASSSHTRDFTGVTDAPHTSGHVQALPRAMTYDVESQMPLWSSP